VSPVELNAFLRTHFAGVSPLPVVESAGSDRVTVRLPYDPSSLRPGGSISGPAMMSLADTAAYMALLHRDGSATAAVTSHIGIHFLRKPTPGDLVGVGHIRKWGRRLCVAQVTLFAGDEGTAVADATVSYMMP
jgi:uncharacterized protein (TIGR00369 family)